MTDFETGFWARVNIGEPNECWPWVKGQDSSGYGVVWRRERGRSFRSHQVAFELARGPIPEGLILDHRCHTDDPTCDGGDSCPHRLCANPAHLETVDRPENFRRGRQGRHFTERTHCPSGHEYSPENTRKQKQGKYRLCRECARQATATYRMRRKLGLPLLKRGRPKVEQA